MLSEIVDRLLIGACGLAERLLAVGDGLRDVEIPLLRLRVEPSTRDRVRVAGENVPMLVRVSRGVARIEGRAGVLVLRVGRERVALRDGRVRGGRVRAAARLA